MIRWRNGKEQRRVRSIHGHLVLKFCQSGHPISNLLYDEGVGQAKRTQGKVEQSSDEFTGENEEVRWKPSMLSWNNAIITIARLTLRMVVEEL